MSTLNSISDAEYRDTLALYRAAAEKQQESHKAILARCDKIEQAITELRKALYDVVIDQARLEGRLTLPLRVFSGVVLAIVGALALFAVKLYGGAP